MRIEKNNAINPSLQKKKLRPCQKCLVIIFIVFFLACLAAAFYIAKTFLAGIKI